MSREGSGSLVIAFDDIERLSSAVRAHADFVRSRIGQVAYAATDPDFVASIPLSPLTGVEAESVVAMAVGRLVAYAAVAEGVVLVSATVVSTYRLAEDALAVAAAGLGSTVGVAAELVTNGSDVAVAGIVTSGSIAVLFGAAVVVLKTAADSLIAGFADEFADSLIPGLRKTLDEYGANPSLLIGGGALFALQFGSNIGRAFSMNDVFARAITRGEATLGKTGPFYDDILRALIATGNNLGFFVDREAELAVPPLSDMEIARRSVERAVDSADAIFGDGRTFNCDQRGRIVPSDVVSLFASGRQIDDIGRDSFATIRIITCSDDDGRVTGYTVQIPSTQSFSLTRTTAPNDLSADLWAMLAGERTALERAVLDAMDESGITSDLNGPPILMTGFSLGGITAASIAASGSGYNIQQVVTAGSPIARFEIPDDVDVLTWEANQDVVPSLDGKTNPKDWTTVRRDGPPLATESNGKVLLALDAHDLDRYARMAADEPGISGNPKIKRFFDGNITITDHYATDKKGE